MSDDDVKVHLGCGDRHIPGFVHVDLANHDHVDYHHDVRELPMFEDETIDLLYASHVLEYFDRLEARDVLREWHRVLEPGGILRVAVPDFEALVEVYRKKKDLSLIHGPLYGRWETETPDGTKVLYHRTVYDFPTLKTVLEETGFHDVERYDWSETLHADHDDYSQAYIPHMDKQDGTLISLNVEAVK